MHCIFKIIKHVSIFSNDVRLATMRTLLCIFEDANDNDHSNEEYVLKIAIGTMTDEGVKNKIMKRKID